MLTETNMHSHRLGKVRLYPIQFQAVFPDLVAKRLERGGEPLAGFPVTRIPPTELVRRKGGAVAVLSNTTVPYRDPKTAKYIL